MRGANPLTRQQIKEVLGVTTTIREKALLVAGMATGYRISELLSLKVSDVCTKTAYGVNAIHSHINVKASNTKGGKQGRSVLLNSDCKKVLTLLVAWLESKGLDATAPLFVSRKHINGYAAITRQQAGRLLKALFALVGCVGSSYSTHTMRKTYASIVFLATGKNLALTSIALGHRSVSSTMSYLSFNTSEIDDVINAMEF